jgi:hypothetical protein
VDIGRAAYEVARATYQKAVNAVKAIARTTRNIGAKIGRAMVHAARTVGRAVVRGATSAWQWACRNKKAIIITAVVTALVVGTVLSGGAGAPAAAGALELGEGAMAAGEAAAVGEGAAGGIGTLLAGETGAAAAGELVAGGGTALGGLIVGGLLVSGVAAVAGPAIKSFVESRGQPVKPAFDENKREARKIRQSAKASQIPSDPQPPDIPRFPIPMDQKNWDRVSSIDKAFYLVARGIEVLIGIGGGFPH